MTCTYSSMSQCSHFWQDIAIPELYNEIKLKITPASRYRSRRCLSTMTAKPHYCDYVRSLSVYGFERIHCSLTQFPLDMLRQLYIVVSLAFNLEQFEWVTKAGLREVFNVITQLALSLSHAHTYHTSPPQTTKT